MEAINVMAGPTRPCPACGKRMIQHAAAHYACYPPATAMRWWCGCGHSEEAGAVYGTTEAQMRRRSWEEANREGTP